MNYYVYTYSYPDGTPFYVGKGTGRRSRVHLCEAKAGRNLHLWRIRIIKKLLDAGKQPIIKKIIENITDEFAKLIEQEYIAKYGRRDIKTGILVNSTDGGDGASNLNPEIRKKQNDVLVKGGKNTRFIEGVIPWNKNKQMSEHTKQIMSQRKLGTKQSEAAKQNRSLALTGYKHELVECPVCHTVGGKPTMKRWHFYKCSGAKTYRARITINGKRITLGRFSSPEEVNKVCLEAYAKANKPVPKEFYVHKGINNVVN